MGIAYRDDNFSPESNTVQGLSYLTTTLVVYTSSKKQLFGCFSPGQFNVISKELATWSTTKPNRRVDLSLTKIGVGVQWKGIAFLP